MAKSGQKSQKTQRILLGVLAVGAAAFLGKTFLLDGDDGGGGATEEPAPAVVTEEPVEEPTAPAEPPFTVHAYRNPFVPL